jgi:hypothetical protein
VKRALALVAVNVLLFAAFAEVGGLAMYYVDYGGLFYREGHPGRYAPQEVTAERRLTYDALHPYFGPTHKPQAPFEIPPSLLPPGTSPEVRRTNNFGFVAPRDYPVAPAAGEALVGIFGGSVGVWFCQVAAPRLVERLEQRGAFGGRTIVPLCFSHEGYKQPQQLLVLAYFLSIGQTFDAVVNIDGFNEVALGMLSQERGRDVSMPSPTHLEPLVNLIDQATLTPDKVRALAAVQAARDRLNRVAARIHGNRSAAVNFVLERDYQRTRIRYAQEVGRFASLPSAAAAASIVQVTPPVRPRDRRAALLDIARNWAAASVAMQGMLAARGITYVHVLQPNQYHATGRRFGADEVRVAFSDASTYKAHVADGYPLLIAEAARTLLGHERYLDATAVFDGEPDAVYLDNCCHYTRTGNLRLADAVAAAIP